MTKKIVCLLLALACVISLTACGKADTAATVGGNSAAANSDAAPSNPATEPASDATGETTGNTGNTGNTVAPPADNPADNPTDNPADKPADEITWDDDGVLKILTVGNSFSVDCMQFVYEIAKAAGIEKVKLGNLYISGCSLSKHLTNAKSDSAAYTFYTNESGAWKTNNNYKFSSGVKSDNWDFISFQQVSGSSGKANTYDTVNELLSIAEGYCTNENVQFMWHMTWAYQGNSTQTAFADYDKDQMTMYNAIVNAVQTKIVPNQKFAKIIPNGTAVQNARTSYLGDTLTRDGYHMSKDKGRVLAGITVVATTVGIPWDTIDLTKVCSDANFVKVALESAKNAVANPFQVTQSAITTKEENKEESKEESKEDTKVEVTLPADIDLSQYTQVTLELTKCAYYNSTKGTGLTTGNDTAKKFFATQTFTKETLPVGSVILVADGWQYRPEAWKGTATTSSRPKEVTTTTVVITEEWWGNWTTRGFNVTNGSSLSNYTLDQLAAVFQIYIPKQ